MAEKDSSWIREMASAFGMNVTELAKLMGYHRQSLYNAAWGETTLKKERLVEAQRKLDEMNAAMLKADKAIARERYTKRGKLIGRLVDRLSY